MLIFQRKIEVEEGIADKKILDRRKARISAERPEKLSVHPVVAVGIGPLDFVGAGYGRATATHGRISLLKSGHRSS